MTGTITYILSRAGYRAMNGPLADERRRLAGAEPPAAYVSYDPRLLAGAGWYGYRVALKGGDRDVVRRALAMLAEYYIIRDGYEYYEGGVYVVGVLLRQRVPHYGIGGGAPTPEPDALNFYMPNGGTISLNKTGLPTVVELEYSLDRGNTWTIWQEDANGNRSLVLIAGQRMYVRNTSTTSTGFSTSGTDIYNFVFDNTVYANGNLNSLIIKNPTGNESIPTRTFSGLFVGCTTLLSMPDMPSTDLGYECYMNTYRNCSSLIRTTYLPCSLPYSGKEYYRMFMGCSSLKEVRVALETVTISSLTEWLSGVAVSGDFYCPSTLTIPTGVSGIPSGWTRHDI